VAIPSSGEVVFKFEMNDLFKLLLCRVIIRNAGQNSKGADNRYPIYMKITLTR